MKNLAIAMLMIAGSGLAQADYKLVSGDGSELSQVCIAAATAPRNTMLGAAAKAGISAAELASVRCNNLPLNRFVAKYGKAPSAGIEATSYVLKGTDNSEITSLCLAAVSSEAEFRKVKTMYFSRSPMVEEEVRCNGLRLKSFSRKYGKSAMVISQR
ncbi:MAG TPA: hypothetical protein GX696_00950 [Pseudomonadaceae bacterium]|nr:hypothetical protein [Pseudomonadaceae bacterium]